VLALKGDASPILLAGAGADEFCERAGLTRRDPALLSGEGVGAISGSGTVGAVALDANGHLAAATSTGGRLDKLPGRVGDSPIVGAGTWADDESAAVSGTGAGEAFILAGFAHRVDWDLKAGSGLRAAVIDALHAVRTRGGGGGAIALAPGGRFTVAFDTTVMARAWRDVDGSTVRPLGPGEGSGPTAH
jgi:isoaspartyl peptidase/L-asparaginase-like protein (Ntn-hydrolase superfamily)